MTELGRTGDNITENIGWQWAIHYQYLCHSWDPSRNLDQAWEGEKMEKKVERKTLNVAIYLKKWIFKKMTELYWFSKTAFAICQTEIGDFWSKLFLSIFLKNWIYTCLSNKSGTVKFTSSTLAFIKYLRQWHPTPVLLPGKPHGRRSLVGCRPWGRWGSDKTERLHFHFSLSCVGEGNGNPLQCSCLKNHRDREPDGLPSMGSHRAGHDRSDLAVAVA